MKKCNDCNVDMIEDTNLHTDYVGGVSFEEQIYLTFNDGTTQPTKIFGMEVGNGTTKRVKARVCPTCGKVELFVDIDEK